MPLLRVPFTEKLPDPRIIPAFASTLSGAVDAVCTFLSTPSKSAESSERSGKTILLTGAGISVASGLADYRGTAGTYTLNKTYRPVYYGEFIANHEARKRYWARSFLGWTNLHKARPNAAHFAVRDLADLGYIKSVITQNVDSFHSHAHPDLPTIELHGYLRSLVCVQCRNHLPRGKFQKTLTDLNPKWADFLAEMLAVGAFDTENPAIRASKGLKSNPDGDVDVPDAPYTTFRYPACPTCLKKPPILPDGSLGKVKVDDSGAWLPESTAGVLKPAVIMFGESISADVKEASEHAIDSADRILVVGSSLATYSAWRLVKRAHERGMPVAIVNVGGARGEDAFYSGISDGSDGSEGVRCISLAEELLPQVVSRLKDA